MSCVAYFQMMVQFRQKFQFSDTTYFGYGSKYNVYFHMFSNKIGITYIFIFLPIKQVKSCLNLRDFFCYYKYLLKDLGLVLVTLDACLARLMLRAQRDTDLAPRCTPSTQSLLKRVPRCTLVCLCISSKAHASRASVKLNLF